MQKLIATWNTVRGVWEKPETESLLCGHSEPFSETWPTSGTTRNGQAFELPTPARRTIVSESSFSLSVPTPKVFDVHFEGRVRKITEESPNRGVDLPLWAERVALLRTPTAAEVDGGPVSPAVARAKGQTLRLTGQVLDLLPTPNTQEGSGKCRDWGGDLTHAVSCECKNWGDFAPAIALWESVTGRQAPDATLTDGQKGQHRLSARFVEWLMGLPDGWIVDCDVSRRDAIKMGGNGVVPQQAKYALSILKERLL